MERNTVNVSAVGNQYPEHWWYEAHCLSTRHAWDILIRQLGERGSPTGLCGWRCSCPGFPTGTGSAHGHDEAKELALAHIQGHDQ